MPHYPAPQTVGWHSAAQYRQTIVSHRGLLFVVVCHSWVFLVHELKISGIQFGHHGGKNTLHSFHHFWPHHNAVTFLVYLTFDQDYCSRLCFNNQLVVYRPKWRLKTLSPEKCLDTQPQTQIIRRLNFIILCNLIQFRLPTYFILLIGPTLEMSRKTSQVG